MTRPQRLLPLLFLPLLLACTAPGTARQAALAESPVFDPAAYSPLAAVLAGEHAFARGDDRAAAQLLAIAQRAWPQNEGMLTRLMLAEVNSGAFARAAKRAAAMDEAGSGNPLSQLIGLVGAVKAGDVERAQHLAETFPEDGISGVAKPLFLAWLQSPETAATALSSLLGRQGVEAIAALHLALIEDLKTGKAGAASLARLAGFLSAAPTLPSRALDIYAALLARAGRRGDLDALLAARAGKGQREDAMLPKLRARAGKAPPAADRAAGIAQALFDLAVLLAAEEEPEQAKLFANLALVLDPKLDVARLVLADERMQRGRFQEAAAYLEAIPSSSLYAWPAALALAEVSRRRGDAAAAAARLQAAAKARPDRVEPLVALGDLLRQEERFAEAAKAYDRAIALAAPPRAGDWRLFFSRGIALERGQAWEKAEADLKTALVLSPDQPYVLNYLAYSWVERGERLPEALAMLKKAASLKPEDGAIADSLGWAWYRLGDFAAAVAWLEKAVALAPADAAVNDHLGDAYWRVGRRIEARFQWQRALNAEPEARLIPMLRRKLEEGLAE